MKNKKPFLALYLIVAFVIIISAVVVSLTAGINLGIDVGGGTQIEVVVPEQPGQEINNKYVQEQEEAIKAVLKENNLSAEKIIVQDKDSHVYMLIRVANNSIKNQAELKADLAETFDIKDSQITSTIISGSLTKKTVLWAGVTIVCLLLAVFVAGWVRYGVMSGLTFTFTSLLALMLNVALHVITRLPITFTSIIVMLCSVALVLFALVLTFEKIREAQKSRSSEKMTLAEVIAAAKNRSVLPLVCVVAMIFVVALVFVFIPVSFIQLSACSIIVCLVAGVYSYLCIALGLHEKLLEIKEATDAVKQSRNNSPAPQEKKPAQEKKATRPKSSKKVAPKKAKKEEDNKIQV